MPNAASNKTPFIIAGAVVVALAAVTIFRDRGGNQADAPLAGSDTDASTPATSGDSPAGRPGNAGTRERASIDATAQARLQQLSERRAALREEQMRKQTAMRTKVAAEFKAERTDARWSQGKERELDGIAKLPSIQAVQAEPMRMDIECRSRSCKIESVFDTKGHAEDWLITYMSSVGNAMPTAVVTQVPNPDGSITVEIYGKGR